MQRPKHAHFVNDASGQERLTNASLHPVGRSPASPPSASLRNTSRRVDDSLLSAFVRAWREAQLGRLEFLNCTRLLRLSGPGTPARCANTSGEKRPTRLGQHLQPAPCQKHEIIWKPKPPNHPMSKMPVLEEEKAQYGVQGCASIVCRILTPRRALRRTRWRLPLHSGLSSEERSKDV